VGGFDIEAPLHALLLAALDRIPKDISFLVLSREEPPPLLARLRACRQLTLFTWEDLRLTSAECLEIVVIEGKEHSFPDIDMICTQVEVWAAGLRIFMEAAELKMEEPGNLDETSPQMIFDYFTHEIFQNFSEKLRIFLVKTSFLPQIKAESARQLTGIPDSGHILQSLARNNQFTKRNAHSGHYSFHPLFLSVPRENFPDTHYSLAPLFFRNVITSLSAFGVGLDSPYDSG
jgi:LuxR family transcriptional regulator, maltose regulon positive regulatory protein